MKELSIEEKAKRFDEAYKKVAVRFGTNVADEIFLKESEDERIRGNIIATIHLYYGEPLEDEAKEMIAWLEKQGEQKPAWSEYDEMFVHGLIRGLAAKKNIHGHTTFSSDNIDITNTIDWLKSLKDRVQPQSQWKPSDEQIELLREVQQALLGKDCHNRFVNFIYELKRLREE